jgi:hypothetical protein
MSSIAGKRKRDSIITPTAIAASISDVCKMTEAQIGDSQALVFTTDSTMYNASLPACIFGAFVNVTTLSFSGIGLMGEIPMFYVPSDSNLTYLSPPLP